MWTSFKTQGFEGGLGFLLLESKRFVNKKCYCLLLLLLYVNFVIYLGYIV